MAQATWWRKCLPDDVTENSLQQCSLVALCREMHCGFEELGYLRSSDAYTLCGLQRQRCLEFSRIVHAHANCRVTAVLLSSARRVDESLEASLPTVVRQVSSRDALGRKHTCCCCSHNALRRRFLQRRHWWRCRSVRRWQRCRAQALQEVWWAR